MFVFPHSFSLRSYLLKIIHNPLCRQTPGYHRSGHARPWMCACANEIKILVTCMLVARAEVTQLRQVVAKSVCRAFHQVVALPPGEWAIVHFEFQMCFQVRDAEDL